MSSRTIVEVVLRVTGLGMLGATFFVFCPFGWMAWINNWMGLAELEYTPVVSYLIRTLSAMYVIVGLILLYVSLDVRRYREFIRFFGTIAVVGGVAVTLFDAVLKLPLLWTIFEGPLTVGLGVCLRVFGRQIRRQ